MPLRGDYKKDVDEVKETAIKMLSREYSNSENQFRLINGYRRVDPRRGAEYILDIGIKMTSANQQEVMRYINSFVFSFGEAVSKGSVSCGQVFHIIPSII